MWISLEELMRTLSHRAALFKFFEEAHRVVEGQRPHHVALSLFDREPHRVALGPKHRRLLLHLIDPIAIEFANMHVDAQLRQRSHALWRGVRKVSRKAGH